MFYNLRQFFSTPLGKISSAARALYFIIRKIFSKCFQLLGKRQATHIIICGSPRSGTSMFCNMLATTLQNFNFDYKDESGSKQTIFYKPDHVSKSPLDVLNLAEISRRNIHNKRIIALILIRDPRDIITSVHENVPDSYFIGYDASFRVWGDYPNYKYEYDNIGLGQTEEYICNSVNINGIHAVILRYEDIVADPDTVQKMLEDKFELKFEGFFSDFHNADDKHVFKPELTKPLDESLIKWNKPVSTDWVSRWKQPQHHQRIIEQFEKFPQLFDMLQRYGYEEDNKWFEDFTKGNSNLTKVAKHG